MSIETILGIVLVHLQGLGLDKGDDGLRIPIREPEQGL
jgi:hypothetical protein